MNLHKRVVILRETLEVAQIALDGNPHSIELTIEEFHYLKAYDEAFLEEGVLS